MKRLAALVILMAAGSAAIPSSAAATAAACRSGSANEAECRTLATCYIIGAAVFNYAGDAEAVSWTRRCLALDRRYRLADRSSGRLDARERSKRLRAPQSTFRSLYCLAVRRAGRPEPRVCRVRATSPRRRGGRRSPDSGTRDPTLTG